MRRIASRPHAAPAPNAAAGGLVDCRRVSAPAQRPPLRVLLGVGPRRRLDARATGAADARLRRPCSLPLRLPGDLARAARRGRGRDPDLRPAGLVRAGRRWSAAGPLEPRCTPGCSSWRSFVIVRLDYRTPATRSPGSSCSTWRAACILPRCRSSRRASSSRSPFAATPLDRPRLRVRPGRRRPRRGRGRAAPVAGVDVPTLIVAVAGRGAVRRAPVRRRRARAHAGARGAMGVAALLVVLAGATAAFYLTPPGGEPVAEHWTPISACSATRP